MREKDVVIAIGELDKLIEQERAAVRSAMRTGNRNLEENASMRYADYVRAKDRIMTALVANMDERDADNPFLPQRD